MRLLIGLILTTLTVFPSVGLAQSSAEAALFENQLQIVKSSLNRPDSALTLLSGVNWRGKSDSLQAEYYKLKGSAYYYQGTLDSSISNFTTAARIIDSLGCNNQFSHIYNGLAVVLQSASLRKEAINCYTKALGCVEFRDDQVLKRKIYNNLSILNRDLGNYDRAQYYLNLAFELVEEEDLAGLAVLYNSRGQNYLSMNQLDSARDMFALSLSMRDPEDARGKAISLNNLGYTAALQNDLVSAQQHYSEVAKIREEIGDLYGSVSIAINLADLSMSQNDLNRATDLLHSAELLNARVRAPELRSRLYASQSTLEEKKGNHALALEMLKRHKQLEDSLRATELVKEITASQYTIALAQAENKVKRIEREELLRQEVIKRQRLINLVLAVGIAIFIGLLALLLYQLKLLSDLRNTLTEERDGAEHKAKFRRETLHTVVHELRTPMNAIKSLAELIEQEQNEDELKSMTGLLRRSSDRLLGITNNVLTYARLEDGELDVVMRTQEISELVLDLVRMLEPQATLKQLSFTREIEPGLRAMADRTMLEIVLINVIGNAIKFTDAGGVHVEVSGGKKHVEIVVRDTGIGIAPEEQDKVFEPFFQSSIQDSFHGGSGLGLSIVAEYIKEMDAQIHMKSEVGVGTSIFISLTRVVD